MKSANVVSESERNEAYVKGSRANEESDVSINRANDVSGSIVAVKKSE